MDKPVVIVGGGLAGLVCARRLHRAGIDIRLLEATERVGGRLKTDRVEGFLIDRGFQVYFEAYPNAAKELSYSSLSFCRYRKGATIARNGHLTALDVRRPLASLWSTAMSEEDKFRFALLAIRFRALSVASIRSLPDQSTLEFLKDEGFSDAFFSRFARPFFGGVFTDPNLSVSCRQFGFVMKMLASGAVSTPAIGIEALPRQIVAGIPRSRMTTHARVRSVGTGEVTLDSGESVPASAVVVATDPRSTAKLLNLPAPPPGTSTIDLFFASPKRPIEQPYIVLNGQGEGIVNQIVPLSTVNWSSAPSNKQLVSATILGVHDEDDEVLAEKVRREVEPWFPRTGVREWRLLRAHRIEEVQVAQPPGFDEAKPGFVSHLPGVFVAGEWTTNGSIDGACESGAKCAEIVMRTLKT